MGNEEEYIRRRRMDEMLQRGSQEAAIRQFKHRPYSRSHPPRPKEKVASSSEAE